MSEAPQVRIPPPVIYAGVLLVGGALQRVAPESAFPGMAWTIAAYALGAIAIAIAGWALITFRRARTAIEPWKAASQLVTHGPYAYMRNPMYVALTLLTLGIGLILDWPWAVAFVPVAVILTDRFVVRHEEAHLSHVFGPTYDDYCTRVRRWGIV
jgi:protein-S-isoprenylcysteine O-methyltransferase Ste14